MSEIKLLIIGSKSDLIQPLLEKVKDNNILIFKECVDKDVLYRKIWKRDKLIQINKLDTHLTNLKNKLNDELNLNVNFHSTE